MVADLTEEGHPAGVTNLEQEVYERMMAERQEREQRIAGRDDGG